MKLKSKKIKSKRKGHLLLLISVPLTILSLSILIYITLNTNIDKELEKNKINDFFNNNYNMDIATGEAKKSIYKDSYIAVLEIPKISLKKGLNAIDSKANNENKNIKILYGTTFPSDKAESHIFLASHSGNSNIAYFKNLNNLAVKDEVFFYYHNNKYIYEVKAKYKINKTGNMSVKLKDLSNMYLITCDKQDNTKQIVVYAELTAVQDTNIN